MIKLATVFSGIGAIEHALERMGLEHQIVFACDNGDVDILNKEVSFHIDEVGAELKHLNKVIGEIGLDAEVEDLYKMQLVPLHPLYEYSNANTLRCIFYILSTDSTLPYPHLRQIVVCKFTSVFLLRSNCRPNRRIGLPAVPSYVS